MNDNLPPLPMKSLLYETRDRFDDPLHINGYTAEQMQAYARAAIERQSVPALWAIHVPGPDDLYPAPSYEAAKHMAAKHNTAKHEKIQAAPKTTPLGRTIDLHEQSGMPWDQAEKLALEEVGIGDTEIDELIGNASSHAIVGLLDDEEVREFVRSILVHQYALKPYTPPQALAQPAQPLTKAQRAKVCVKAEAAMQRDQNLSWRDALINETEQAHGIPKGTT